MTLCPRWMPKGRRRYAGNRVDGPPQASARRESFASKAMSVQLPDGLSEPDSLRLTLPGAHQSHVDGRCGQGFTSPMPEPFKPGDQVFIEDGYLTIENQSGFRESADYLGEFTKSLRVIPTIPAEEMHLPISLES